MNVREAMANFRGHRTPNLNIVGRKRFWFALSGFLILLSVVGLAARGLNFSIDFRGGSLLTYSCPKCVSGGVTPDSVRAVLDRFGLTDAAVQVVNGDTMTVRTRSLTTLGGQPATILKLPNSANVSVQQLQTTMAELGYSEASVSATGSGITIHSQPLTRSQAGLTLTYSNKKNLTASAIQSQLAGLGYPGAVVDIVGTTVVVRFTTLPVNPPSPAPSPSAKASKASATPTPTASPTPSVQGRAAVIASLATPAGVKPSAVAVRDLSTLHEGDVVNAIAQQAGVSPSSVTKREITGKEQQNLLSALAAQAGTSTAQINRQDVGPTWGAQISSKALKGLIIFLVVVTLYIALRFEWKMALAAQTALLHDLVITAGIYALVGRTVSPATVIAILTILGYSLYDTVVIFDKVKENTESQAMLSRETYSGVVNISMNQVFMRSVNTSLVVLLPILMLLLFGGSTLKDFAFALFVGVASGTYSSIFVASPMLAVLKEREPKYRQIRQRVETRAARPQLRPVPAIADGGDGELEPTAPAPARQAGPRPAQQQPGQRPKKRRKTTAAQRRRR